ncbi:MAG TPA: hypothetical protein VJ867_13945 [Gemmatimonadaceae bacterium]|nr:hypothetical protein [Gemmatimonadaceae bacterium]
MKHSRPEDLFRAEKERATSARNSQHARLLAEAKAAFDKLMAEGQAARKSGRPRKHPLPPLKTSSSRTPPKPPAPPAARPAPVIALPAAPPASKAVAAAKRPKPEVRGSIKRASTPKRGAKAEGRTASGRGASSAKSKTKAKRSSRR